MSQVQSQTAVMCTVVTAFNGQVITVLFINTWTLKFKTQPTGLFFIAVNIIADISGNNDALHKMVKRSCLSVVIGEFQFILPVFVFRGSMFVSIYNYYY